MSRILGEPAAAESGRPAPEPGAKPSLSRILYVLAVALGVGALAGVVWWAVVDLPTYSVSSGGEATTTERGLTAVIGGDAWFALLGVVGGLLIGGLSWWRLRALGWPVVLVAALAGAAAGLVCWLVGQRLGPGDFTDRIAAAQPGEVVPIELTIRARSALLVWPLAAVTWVLLGSSLGRDPEDATRRQRPSR